MLHQIHLEAIGWVKGGRILATDDAWGGVRSTIQLDANVFTADALRGLADFSHIEVVYVFHGVDAGEIEKGSRRPRGRTDWPDVGIFAQRGRNRPNRLGLCACRLIAVRDLQVEVEGLDAIDGSPVLDLKPVMTGFTPRGEVREPAWAKEIMAAYW
jgi:tRNA (Thr-GGU) A37 N-methylase